jgi:hypothetical protein
MNAVLSSSPVVKTTPARVDRTWWRYLLWIAAATLIGFTIAGVFAGLLHLPRSTYLIPHVGSVTLFLYSYLRWSGLSITDLLRHNWIWGVVAAMPLGAFTVGNILSQPASARSEGLYLAFDLLWIGAIYGLVDALLLSVLPVLATRGALSALGWTKKWPGKILVSVIAFFASLLVPVGYHLGYPECRLPGDLFGPILGNGATTLGYVLTGNPIAAILSHIAMHIAGVLHGLASVTQLPPHY